MARKTAEENRRHILSVASGLYYARGIRAVGMDLVVKESGVGNATVYRQFPTKNALAGAYTQERADAWFARMRESAGRAGDARGQLLAIFAGVVDEITAPGFRGCPMHNAHTEFPDPDHPAHQVAVTHERRVRDWMRDLAGEAGAPDPGRLADELVLVLNGVYATAATLGPEGPARHTLDFVDRLVRAACEAPGRA
ncbi:TetR/AcrR family transcriptional regulator [Streptomyces sp. CA-253872]|uniref:TetR/AcrR family transcriptional regulator n=1 Tax=Streptomyces sp. CA-253872 TaxID=3240067 RepID=UPI003D8A316D